MKEIKAYECDYSKRIYKTKAAMKKHESRCFLNQDNKACWLCKYKVLQINDDDENVFSCAKLNKDVKEVAKDMNTKYFFKQDAIMNCEYFELKYNTNKEQ